MKRLRIIDTTLRDGMHAVSHGFSPENVAAIASGLERAGADTTEVSHGDGLGGSSMQYGLSAYPEEDLIRAAVSQAMRMKIAVLILPGIGTCENLEMAQAAGARVVRVATHVTEANIAQQHIGYAKKLGMEAIGFLMMTHMASPETILEQALLFEGYGADAVYCADSAGAMLPVDVRARISLLKEKLAIPVGFHAHNNLGLAVGNSLAAMEAGADLIDATLRGLGAGAGNAPHEVLAAALKKLGAPCDEDVNALMDVAEDVVAPLMYRPLAIDRAALSIGYAGVYSSFFLHARRAAERFGLDEREILYELGRLKTVGGQEDMIVDVAHSLSLERGKAQ